MKQLLALIQNEFLALVRTGKITVLLIVFSIFGILNSKGLLVKLIFKE